jgi:putative FmdB family regulatory protein
MPIYEFYCSDCNTLFNFFSSKIDTETLPPCPRCERTLERRPASFATLKHQGDGEPDPFAGLDEGALEKAMESMAAEFDGVEDDEDPRQMAHLFRKFGEASGMELGPRMQEMLARLEAGADPEAIEEELGDELDSDEALGELFNVRQALAAEIRRRPRVDRELYFL